MADLQALKAVIDELSADELNEIYNHLLQHRQPNYWLVPSQNLSQILDIMRPIHESIDQLSEQNINDIIDETVDEVRRGRQAQTDRRD